MAKIVVQTGPTPRTIALGAEATIGRQPDNLVHIVEPNASRRHAKISHVGAEFILEDLNSSNGTEVNGQKISRCVLHDGDLIRIGGTKLTFQADAAPAKPADKLDVGEPTLRGPRAPMPAAPPAAAPVAPAAMAGPAAQAAAGTLAPRSRSVAAPPPPAVAPAAPPPPAPPAPAAAAPPAGKAMEYQAAKRTLQQAFNSTAECVYIVDADYQLQRVNIAGQLSTADAAYANLVGRKCYEVLRNRDAICDDCPVREALKQGDTVSVRLPNDYAGQPRPLALRAVPQRDDQGQIRKLMVVVRAEAVLETAQKRSYSVQVDGPDGVVLRAEFSTRGRPYTLGRAKGQDIVLDDPALENVHLSFEVGPAGITVENKSLKDSVAVNQQKLPGGAKLSFADSGDVKVPPYTLKFQRKRVVATMVIKRREGGETMAEVKRNFIQKKVWPEFEARLNLVELERRGVKEVDMRREALKAVKGIVDALPSYPFEGTVDRELLANECAAEFVGLGPMEELLEDADITEIMVLGADTVYVERKGLIERSDRKFLSTSSLRKIIERIVSSKNRRIDESTPYVDTRLDDGSRVHAIIPPLAIDYPVLTIRKFPKHHLSVDDLVRFGSMSPDMANFLELAVKHRQSTVVSGGTGSGKTTILNILSRFIPSNERIITVEDSAELRLQQPHVVRLEARPANIEGKGEVSIRDLVRNCLRMRPDRIIVGECRGREAFDMLQAMNTGHEGSLTTVHANSTRDALGRIESMCLMAAMDLPVPVIRQQIGSAINFVLQQTRLVDGSRKSIMISELTGIEANQLLMQPIFEFKQTGLDKNRKVVGYYTATGMIPKFVERLREIGIPIPLQIFKPTQSAKG